MLAAFDNNTEENVLVKNALESESDVNLKVNNSFEDLLEKVKHNSKNSGGFVDLIATNNSTAKDGIAL